MPFNAKTAKELFVRHITDASCLKDFPSNHQRIVELTYACENDQALEYQPLVVKDLAQKGYEYDVNLAIPEPTLMRDLVTPENSEGYRWDESWPKASLSIAKVTKSQYEQLWDQPLRTAPDIEMLPPGDEGVENLAQYEEIIFETEEDRLLADSCAAASFAMEVDQGTPDVTSSGATNQPEISWQLPTHISQEPSGVTSPGGTTGPEIRRNRRSQRLHIYDILQKRP
eukprot:6106172-Amphidinium_carterae.1